MLLLVVVIKVKGNLGSHFFLYAGCDCLLMVGNVGPLLPPQVTMTPISPHFTPFHHISTTCSFLLSFFSDCCLARKPPPHPLFHLFIDLEGTNHCDNFRLTIELTVESISHPPSSTSKIFLLPFISDQLYFLRPSSLQL